VAVVELETLAVAVELVVIALLLINLSQSAAIP
jgi:hypothetical protein